MLIKLNFKQSYNKKIELFKLINIYLKLLVFHSKLFAYLIYGFLPQQPLIQTYKGYLFYIG